MACLDSNMPENIDSEMEEGEIVDDLSDISSEEEFLLRQRLQVLENYNNVLERKKAKTGKKPTREIVINDLSEISATEFEDTVITIENSECKHDKNDCKDKRKKDTNISSDLVKNRDGRKRIQRHKKKLDIKVISESSDESEDEYRNKRKKLADAVSVNTVKNDKTSLSSRLQKMLTAEVQQHRGLKIKKKRKSIKVPTKTKFVRSESKNIVVQKQALENAITINKEKNEKTTLSMKLKMMLTKSDMPTSSIPVLESSAIRDKENEINTVFQKEQDNILPTISANNGGVINKSDLEKIQNPLNNSDRECFNEASPNITNKVDPIGKVDEIDSNNCNVESDKIHIRESESEEELELLRQVALKTKVAKKALADDEDSDTTELRLICLKSALLKKAIEMKRKQRIQRRISQTKLEDDFLNDISAHLESENNNNTDIESVDMDIGSDGDEKIKDFIEEDENLNSGGNDKVNNQIVVDENQSLTKEKQNEEIEEDEDLLRAKLLTSLSKNLPNLVNPSLLNAFQAVKNIEKSAPTVKANNKAPDGKRFIIKLDSDSEGEHEATKNLTKMHMKLAEQSEFQSKLDLFLKSTRMEVEKSSIPDVVQPLAPKTPEKFVAKAVKHLPKSEQIEYKNLVKRMAELEKIKQTRINLGNQPVPAKVTLKQRNVTVDTTKLALINKNVEEQIALSRKKIAEESAKMLKLKEEATKLTQKYKIVATELKNISTAITFNRKQQKSVLNFLTRIRLQHQTLLKSSNTTIHSKVSNTKYNNPNTKVPPMTRQQKENNPAKDEYKNLLAQKNVKVSVINDLKTEQTEPNPNSKLCVQVDVTNNKKVVLLNKNSTQEIKGQITVTDCKNAPKNIDITSLTSINKNCIENKTEAGRPIVDKGGGQETFEVAGEISDKVHDKERNEYESPLQAFGSTNWEADPNAILCPFEVGGECKDPDCKYLHTKPLNTL